MLNAIPSDIYNPGDSTHSANITILFHPNTSNPNYNPSLHVNPPIFKIHPVKSQKISLNLRIQMLPRFMAPSSPAPIVSKAIGNGATTSNLPNQMALSAAQQKYYVYWLTRSLPSDSLGKLTASLQDAQVDLTPHQIDAALFAFKSPAINRVLPEIAASLAYIIAAQRAKIKLRKSESKKTSRLDEEVSQQRLIKDLEKRRSEKRLNLYQAQDEVDEKKETLFAKVEALLPQKIGQTNLITLHWKIV